MKVVLLILSLSIVTSSCLGYNANVWTQELAPLRPTCGVLLSRDDTSTNNIYKQSIQLPNILGYVVFIFEFLRLVQSYKKQNIENKVVSYEMFCKDYSNLLPLEQKIIAIQSLIHQADYGLLPERILARFSLLEATLCKPYDTVINKCKKKLYAMIFNVFGELQEVDRPIGICYKKFYKKVPQTYQQMIMQASKIKNNTQKILLPNILDTVCEEQKNTLFDIIYAGINDNFPRIKKLCRAAYDKLIIKLYDYYVDQYKAYQNHEKELLYHATLLGLEYSDSTYDEQVQDIADLLLHLLVIAYETNDDIVFEQYKKTISNLYDTLIEM